MSGQAGWQQGWVGGAIALGIAIFTQAPSAAQLPELPPIDSSTPPIDSPADSPPDSTLPAPLERPEQPGEPEEPSRDGPLREAIACPTTLTELTPLLIRDLPTYTNRVMQRSLGYVPELGDGPPLAQYRPTYVVLAGQADLEPLDISERVYTTSPAAGETLEQLFFTTLERTYDRAELTEITHFHWLFLAPDDTGWRLAFMFSAINSKDDNRPVLPPRESSSGSVGRGVQLWLRDCRAGAIAP